MSNALVCDKCEKVYSEVENWGEDVEGMNIVGRTVFYNGTVGELRGVTSCSLRSMPHLCPDCVTRALHKLVQQRVNANAKYTREDN